MVQDVVVQVVVHEVVEAVVLFVVVVFVQVVVLDVVVHVVVQDVVEDVVLLVVVVFVQVVVVVVEVDVVEQVVVELVGIISFTFSSLNCRSICILIKFCIVFSTLLFIIKASFRTHSSCLQSCEQQSLCLQSFKTHEIFEASASINFDKLTSSSAIDAKRRFTASSSVMLIHGLISGIFGNDMSSPLFIIYGLLCLRNYITPYLLYFAA